MNGHNRVLAIVLAAEHLLRLAGVDRAGEIVEALGEIVGNWLSGFRPLNEDGKVVGPSSQGLAEVAVFPQRAPPLKEFLRGPLILPEIRIRYPLFYCGELFCGAGGVKDSSAGRMHGGPGPDTCEADRRVELAYELILSNSRRREKSSNGHDQRQPGDEVTNPTVD